MKRINVVYSLILDETKTKILMVKNKDNNRWSLPGGAVEEGECFDEAAVREVKEETGFDINIHGIVAVNEAKISHSNEHALFITFNAEIVGGNKKIIRPEEITDIQWISLEESNRLMPYYKEGLSGLVQRNSEVTYFNEGTV
ncbi:NUDIX hydrolase [Paenibacillus sp. 453mf]|uniref:NUDIX hydrolase n=1 Tax=Paenibacillus sp. 453mf TaxID=1761874 RepID=UPI0008E34C05|nr:NUDIX hydrolase [Paenibacillus sp. 453mf]SFS40972.1 8-oxo-dGTP diphosphatase [Paenibacillus sp. 453mf]